MNKSLTVNENFYRNVLSVVCSLGLLRVLIEIFRNDEFSRLFDFYLDLGYGVVFTLALVALLNKSSYRVIYLAFYVPLVILLCLTLFEQRGLASSIENNIHVGLVVIALTMRSGDALKFSIYLIIGTLMVLIAVEIQHNFLDNYADYSTSHFNYIYMAIGVIFITYYSKRVFENSKTKLSQIKEKLTENRDLLQASRQKLQFQTKELESLNIDLENKVNERARHLNNQREAMEKYLNITLKELQKDYAEVKELTNSVLQESSDDVSKMMRESAQDLDHEIETLVNKLKDER